MLSPSLGIMMLTKAIESAKMGKLKCKVN
jgi:hypothetical protein